MRIFQSNLKIISLILIITSSIPAALAQQPMLDTNFRPPQKPSKNILQGNIAESQYLPPAIYGTWQVISTLISTNAPHTFRKKTSDIWILRQTGDKIVLLNPDTGAKSYVKVKAVKDNTATFSCQTINRDRIDTEHPTITVSENKFTGRNLYTVQYIKHNQMIHTEQAFFEIKATRLSGPVPGLFKK